MNLDDLLARLAAADPAQDLAPFTDAHAAAVWNRVVLAIAHDTDDHDDSVTAASTE